MKKKDTRIRPTRLTTSVILVSRGKILLVREGKGNAHGKWNQPAGHIDPGETPMVCAIREAREESGYRVRLTSLLGVIYDPERLTIGKETSVNFCFLAVLDRKQKQGKLADDVLEARWFSPKEIGAMKKTEFRGSSTLRRLTWWQEKRKGISIDLIHIPKKEVYFS